MRIKIITFKKVKANYHKGDTRAYYASQLEHADFRDRVPFGFVLGLEEVYHGLIALLNLLHLQFLIIRVSMVKSSRAIFGVDEHADQSSLFFLVFWISIIYKVHIDSLQIIENYPRTFLKEFLEIKRHWIKYYLIFKYINYL